MKNVTTSLSFPMSYFLREKHSIEMAKKVRLRLGELAPAERRGITQRARLGHTILAISKRGICDSGFGESET